MPTHERTIRTGAGMTRYLEAGAGWPVLLLHAFPLSADMWQPQLERVPEGYRIIAPDLRGFGPAARAGAASLDEMAADLVELLDALRIERATIGGLSMGGYVTLALYREAPERFTGLILANTRAGADSAEAREGRDGLAVLAREKGSAAVADAMLPKLLGQTSRESQPALGAEVRRMIEANPAEGIARALQAMKARPDSTAMLGTVGHPALVITGEEDGLIPRAESEDMHSRLPRSQHVVVPGAGHLSNMENADDFSEALGNFLLANL